MEDAVWMPDAQHGVQSLPGERTPTLEEVMVAFLKKNDQRSPTKDSGDQVSFCW